MLSTLTSSRHEDEMEEEEEEEEELEEEPGGLPAAPGANLGLDHSDSLE